jgi:hypothetical protein
MPSFLATSFASECRGVGIVARPIVKSALRSTVDLITPLHRPTTLLADGAIDIFRQVLEQTLRQKRASLEC